MMQSLVSSLALLLTISTTSTTVLALSSSESLPASIHRYLLQKVPHHYAQQHQNHHRNLIGSHLNSLWENTRVLQTVVNNTIFIPLTSPTAAPAAATTTDDRQCLDATTVNFDDDFSRTVYGPTYQGVCTCTQTDNSNELLSELATPPNPITATPQEIQDFVDNFNNLFGGLVGGYSYDCTSGCATCFAAGAEDGGDYCGFLTATEETAFQGKATNFTFDDILSGLTNFDPNELIADSTFSSESCVTFERGETGELCFGLDWTGLDVTTNVAEDLANNALPTCRITYNGEPCNSCNVLAVSTGDAATAGAVASSDNSTIGCYEADCTNFDAAATLNSCAKTGYVGPFRVMQYLAIGENATVSLGTCTGGGTNATVSGGGGDGGDGTIATDSPPIATDTLAPSLAPVAATGTSEAPFVELVPENQTSTATTFPTPSKGAVSDGEPTVAPMVQDDVTNATESETSAPSASAGGSASSDNGNRTTDGEDAGAAADNGGAASTSGAASFVGPMATIAIFGSAVWMTL